MPKTLTPSAVARFMAAAEWPQIHTQTMIAKGVYWFSCAGHGGCIAVRGVADIDDRAWQVAREKGHTAFIAPNPGRMYDSRRYRFDTTDPRCIEVWIGEEDCEWSTIFVAHNNQAKMIERADSKGFRFGDTSYSEGCCERWYPETLAALKAIRSTNAA